MSILHIDFETRSACDLKARGAHVYAQDPTTEILCMAYAFDEEPVQLWKRGGEFPARVQAHIGEGKLVIAHNAAFELCLWNEVQHRRLRFAPMRIEQMRCTMAMAYAMGLPGSLADAAAAVGIAQRKDAKGQRVMLQLCKPRSVADDGTVTWWDDPAKLETLYAYCKQDVEVERALHHRLLELSATEQALWQLDQKINNRGVAVDLAAIESAIALVEAEQKRLNGDMRAATAGAVATCTATGQLTDWLRWRGVALDGVAKNDITELLADKGLPADARWALTLRREAAKSSTAKLKKMHGLAGSDGRIRGMFQYHGAATGRWAARGAQLQNLPRPALAKTQVQVEDAIAHFGSAAYLDIKYGSPLQVISDCLRGMLIPAPGCEFICADYANIEGRVLPWLAGEEWKLDAFRAFDAGNGPDLYLVAVSRGRKIPIEECAPFRQEGKVEELAFQFGGGEGAMTTWCATFGLEMDDEEKELRKTRWRGAHPAVVQFWRDLESAAIRAVTRGGTHRAGSIAFKKAGSFLWCQLPSGRTLCYPYPEVADKEMPWSTPEKPAYRAALSYMAVNGLTRKWERCDTYGGSLAENVTQAVARDLLADAITRAEAAGWKAVMHVHDEIVIEAPCGAVSVDNLTTLLRETPAWAAGLPVAAEGWRGPRYRKA